MMEKIGLNNYEAYLLDYMEGSLGVEEKADLFAFLAKYPELKADLDLGIMDAELFPVEVQYDAKSDLKFDEGSLKISPDTIEEFMIASIEDQLSTPHNDQVKSYIQKNKLNQTYKTYQATRLKADQSISFPDKEELKKRAAIIPLYQVGRIAAVAAVGLIVIGFAWSQFYSSNSTIKLNQRTALRSHNLTEYIAQQKQIFSGYNDKIKTNEVQSIDPIINEASSLNLIAQSPANSTKSSGEPKENKGEFIEKLRQSTAKSYLPETENIGLALEKSKVDSIPTYKFHVEKEEDEFLASARTIKREEPYKVITTAAGDVINRKVQFTRDKDIQEDSYVAYSFTLGRFEFERKKSK